MNHQPPRDHVIDVRGQICPSTLLVTLREMNRLKERLRAGEVRLVVHTDYRDATATVPGSARAMGYDVAVEPDGASFRITIQAKRE
ncbi:MULTISPECIES: sulfurtransferase TusA family protein [Deferrisoma]